MADTTLTLTRGDSGEYTLTFTDDAGTPLDLSRAVDGTAARPAIVRFAVKEDLEDSNDDAIVFKTTYAAADAELLDQSVEDTQGQCRVFVDKADTEEIDVFDTPRWDVEVTRQDFVRTEAGTASVALSSRTVTGVGTLFLLAKVGDVFQPLGDDNVKPVKIASIASNTSLTVEAAIFTTEAAIDFEIRRGQHKTPLRGDFVLVDGVVAE